MVAIKDMEMPKSCSECDFCYEVFGYGDYECEMTKKTFEDADIRHADCPLCEVKIGHCKDCKYFEYDSFANIDGVPIVIAHEICKRWDNKYWGNKTKEDGYCFLFEPKEGE